MISYASTTSNLCQAQERQLQQNFVVLGETEQNIQLQLPIASYPGSLYLGLRSNTFVLCTSIFNMHTIPMNINKAK